MEGKASFKVIVFNNTDKDLMRIQETFKNRRNILHYYNDLTAEKIMDKLEEGKQLFTIYY